MMTHTVLRVSLTFILVGLIAATGLAAEITPDMDPTPGPGKITSTGKYKLGKGETLVAIRILASPVGGAGGMGGFKKADTGADTYTGTIENLAANTEYDVTIYLEYFDDQFKQKAVYSKTYAKVKTK